MIVKFKLFESLYENETFYKLVTKENWLKIQETNTILPLGRVKEKDIIHNGNWAIPKSNLESWLTNIKYFGSPLQALLMKSSATNEKMVLLELKINKQNTVYNRDISKMFIDFSFSDYHKSFSDKNIYNITESFIGGIITDFKFINEFIVPTEVSKYISDPESLLNFTYDKGDIIYTDKKMTSIKSAFFQVLLKKVFSFNFKKF